MSPRKNLTAPPRLPPACPQLATPVVPLTLAPTAATASQGAVPIAQAQNASAQHRVMSRIRADNNARKRAHDSHDNPDPASKRRDAVLAPTLKPEAPSAAPADTTPPDYGPAPATPTLIDQRKMAIQKLENTHQRAFELQAIEDIERSVKFCLEHSPAWQLLLLSTDALKGTGSNLTRLMRVGDAQGNEYFQGLSPSEVPYFYRAQLAAHRIIKLMHQVDFVNAEGHREQRTDAQGRPRLDQCSGEPDYRKIGQSSTEAAPTPQPTANTPKSETDATPPSISPHTLETRQITAFTAEYVASVYKFHPGDSNTQLLKKSITNQTSPLWAERLIAISRKHSPQMLAFMFQAHDSVLSVTQREPDRVAQKRKRNSAYRIRNGLADILLACSPEQAQQLFDTVEDQERYRKVCTSIKPVQIHGDPGFTAGISTRADASSGAQDSQRFARASKVNSERLAPPALPSTTPFSIRPHDVPAHPYSKLLRPNPQLPAGCNASGCGAGLSVDADTPNCSSVTRCSDSATNSHTPNPVRCPPLSRAQTNSGLR
jgi:hypothetical protein